MPMEKPLRVKRVLLYTNDKAAEADETALERCREEFGTRFSNYLQSLVRASRGGMGFTTINDMEPPFRRIDSRAGWNKYEFPDTDYDALQVTHLGRLTLSAVKKEKGFLGIKFSAAKRIAEVHYEWVKSKR